MSRATDTTPRSGGLLGRLVAAVRRMNARRRANAELSRMDSRLLADIGVSPERAEAMGNRLRRASRNDNPHQFADLVREFDGPAAPLHPVANDRNDGHGYRTAPAAFVADTVTPRRRKAAAANSNAPVREASTA